MGCRRALRPAAGRTCPRTTSPTAPWQARRATPSQSRTASAAEDGFGGYVVGWGNLPYFSAFDGHGNLTFDASFPTGVNSDRAYLLPWNPGSPDGQGPGGRG